MLLISLIYLKKIFSMFKYIILFFILLILIPLINSFIEIDEYTVIYFLLILVCLYPIALIVQIISICIYFYKELKYNRITLSHFLFMLIYFLFTFFYFLFFIFYFMVEGYLHPDIIHEIFSLIFILFFLFVIIKDFKTFFIRYLAIFITALSDIGLKYIYTDSFIDIFTKNNIEYYKSNLYLIPLSFALIQLGVEMYSFYKKNRAKYMRYKRLLEYKNSKKRIV
jgi:hypothetical protein